MILFQTHISECAIGDLNVANGVLVPGFPPYLQGEAVHVTCTPEICCACTGYVCQADGSWLCIPTPESRMALDCFSKMVVLVVWGKSILMGCLSN